MKTFAEIPIVARTVMVKKLEGEGALKRRIMDMKASPRGTQIYVRKVAPPGRSGGDHGAGL